MKKPKPKRGRKELKDKNLIQEVAQGRKEYQEGGWVPASRLKNKLS